MQQRRGDDAELVVLVDKEDTPIGTALKSEVHHSDTPLHRAFSLFLFDESGRVLVTRRAKSKKTWPGVWSNSVCGHPGPGESREAAVVRRLKEELGCEVKDLKKVADYRYRFSRDGVVENEVCPIYVGVIEGELEPEPEEVEEWKWMEWGEFTNALETEGDKWSEWAREEADLVERLGS